MERSLLTTHAGGTRNILPDAAAVCPIKGHLHNLPTNHGKIFRQDVAEQAVLNNYVKDISWIYMPTIFNWRQYHQYDQSISQRFCETYHSSI